ncbi:Xylose isomerase domain-containing protein TIM barrel [Methanocaldococcus villosus KIN24-T80]|uniref:Xylose isomerase domain-containing protein TIM barrel n=1 Tax=Methanocaldococcus villosus KIN24-T80 TaxID=1069083 RepID=N6VTT4_9EURY|nr:sugar phosphate isomerase/epimerase [Methanocaldococcus villosus]ENN96566.1 Xylose isomerase domain-containing protein TIM barrel [Methanocaldococcus villosus KIN24-T80]
MRIGLSTLFFWEYPMFEIVDIFREIGLKCMEFFPENPDFWDNRFDLDYISELRREFKKFDIGLHAPHIELNPSSLNPYVREASIKETLWSLELAKFYRCDVITIHPGKRPTTREPTKEEYDHFYNYLNICLKEAKKKKITFCMENLPKKINRIGWHPKDVENILKNFEGLYLTLDFPHAKGYLDEFLELYDYIKHTHISGVINNRDHCSLIKSDIDFSKYILELLHRGYKGMFNLELDDRRFGKNLSKEEKINIVIKEVEYLESI